MRAGPVWGVVLLLASGCVSATAPPGAEPIATALPMATGKPTSAPPLQPATNSCGLPERPPGHPDARQVGEGLVQVTIVASGNRPGQVVPGITVAAVAPVQAEAASSFDVDPFFNDCVFAGAQTGPDGSASVWLVPGLEFRVLAAPQADGPSRATAPQRAAEGLRVEVRAFDPSGAAGGDCGVPTAPRRLPTEEAYALDIVPVTLQVSSGGAAEGFVQVVALHGSLRPPFDASFSRMGRFFTECVLAEARTDAAGRAELWLPRGATLHLVAVPSGHGGAAVVDAQVGDGGPWTLEVLPSLLTVTVEGAILLPTEEVVSALVPAGPEGARLRGALRGVGFTTLSWTNEPSGWGDLYGGFRIGDGELMSKPIFDREQGPFDGPVQEVLFPPFSASSEAACQARTQGLDLVVYSEKQLVVAPLKLAFSAEATLYLGNDPAFLDPWNRADC